jgi:hypothetical protein
MISSCGSVPAKLAALRRDNTYRGCRCDVASNMYSFSFAPKANWTRTYARPTGLAPTRGQLDSHLREWFRDPAVPARLRAERSSHGHIASTRPSRNCTLAPSSGGSLPSARPVHEPGSTSAPASPWCGWCLYSHSTSAPAPSAAIAPRSSVTAVSLIRRRRHSSIQIASPGTAGHSHRSARAQP